MEERFLLNRIELQRAYVSPWHIELALFIEPHATDTVPARWDFAVVTTCVAMYPIFFVGQFFVQEPSWVRAVSARLSVMASLVVVSPSYLTPISTHSTHYTETSFILLI